MSKYVQIFRIKNGIIYDTTTNTKIGLEGQRVKNRSNKDNFFEANQSRRTRSQFPKEKSIFGFKSREKDKVLQRLCPTRPIPYRT